MSVGLAGVSRVSGSDFSRFPSWSHSTGMSEEEKQSWQYADGSDEEDLGGFE